jgi:UDP-glucose 4-epimerase
MSGRRALVTGGAGFIGSHVCDAFLDAGYEVEVLDDLSSGRESNLAAGASQLHRLDVTTAAAAQVIREGRFDVISHLAAQIDVRKSVDDPLADARINILGTLNLMEAVKASGRRTRVIFSSTGGALYGDFVTPPNVETFTKDPESPYGVAKLSAELYLAAYGRVFALDTCVLRYANVYGPRQDPHGEAGVVAIFCNRILDGRPLTVFGDGSQTRDYVYVKDVARANVLCAERELPAPGPLDARAWNIGTGVETSVVDLARTLQQAAGSGADIQHAPPRPGELQRSSLEIGKARRELGWLPTVSLLDGLRATYEWFAAQRSVAGT